MIKVENLAQVNAQIDGWLAAVRAEALQKAKGIASTALEFLAQQSPQASGDFAANWKVGINSVDYSFELDALGAPTFVIGDYGRVRGFAPPKFSAGSQAAVGYAISRGTPRINEVKLGDVINISNTAHHDQFYAWKIEDNQIKFRPENAGKGAVITRYMGVFKSGGFPV